MSQADGQEVITAFVDSMRLTFNYIVVTAALSGCLSTLLIVLFAFSTKKSRRRPVFYLNVLAIFLALTSSIFTGITSGTAIFYPFHLVPKGVYLATIAFTVFPPLFYDSILLFRLFALYPPSTTPGDILLKIFAFPFFIKCARIVVLVRFCQMFLLPFLITSTPVTLSNQSRRGWDDHGSSYPICYRARSVP